MWSKCHNYLFIVSICGSLQALEEPDPIEMQPMGTVWQENYYINRLCDDVDHCLSKNRLEEIEQGIGWERQLSAGFRVLRHMNAKKIVTRAARDDAGFQEVLSTMGGSTVDMRAEIWKEFLSGSFTDVLAVSLVRLRTYEEDARQQMQIEEARTEYSMEALFLQAEVGVYRGMINFLDASKKIVTDGVGDRA